MDSWFAFYLSLGWLNERATHVWFAKRMDHFAKIWDTNFVTWSTPGHKHNDPKSHRDQCQWHGSLSFSFLYCFLFLCISFRILFVGPSARVLFAPSCNLPRDLVKLFPLGPLFLWLCETNHAQVRAPFGHLLHLMVTSGSRHHIYRFVYLPICAYLLSNDKSLLRRDNQVWCCYRIF